MIIMTGATVNNNSAIKAADDHGIRLITIERYESIRLITIDCKESSSYIFYAESKMYYVNPGDVLTKLFIAGCS